MKTLVRIRSFILPVSIGLLLVVAAGLYNLVWLPSEQRYLDDRNFRLLTTLSEQISASINNFDQMMDNAVDSGVTNDLLESYLKKVAPQVEKLDLDDRQVPKNAYSDPPKIAVRADEGTHFLYFAFLRAQNNTQNFIKYAIRTDLEKLISNLLPPESRNPFDVILVAQDDGTVIFQRSTSGLAVARIEATRPALPNPKFRYRQMRLYSYACARSSLPVQLSVENTGLIELGTVFVPICIWHTTC